MVWDKDMQTPDDMIAAGEVVLDDVDAKVARACRGIARCG